MKDKKTWTILICCHNSTKTIRATLDSIDCKNNNDIDVFVVDDGSTDNLKAVVEPYTKKYPDVIHYFYKENGNQGSCINFAVKRANSKFFSLLDSDDTFDTKSFNAVLGELRNIDDVDLIIDNYRLFFVNKKKIKIEKVHISKTHKHIKYVDVDKMSLFSLITIHSTIYRTDLLKSIKPMPENVGFSDCVLAYEVLLKTNRVAYLNRSIALYNYWIRKGEQLISLNNSVKKFPDFVKILDLMLQIPIDRSQKKRIQIARKVISHHIYWISVVLANIHSIPKAEKKQILIDVFKKVDACCEANGIKRKLYTPLMRIIKHTPLSSLRLIKFLYSWIPVKMIKATRYSKEAKREAKLLARLEKERAKLAKQKEKNK